MRLFEGTPFDRPPRCEVCEELEGDCRCPPTAPQVTAPGKQTLRIAQEKRKQGKIVTVIRGFASDNDLQELLKSLKSACGAGGSIQSGSVEIQGDQTDRVRRFLLDRGYKIK